MINVQFVDAWTRKITMMRSKKRPAANAKAKAPKQHIVPERMKASKGSVVGFDTAPRDTLAKWIATMAAERAGKGDNVAILKMLYKQAHVMIEGHGAFDGPRPNISIVDQTSCDYQAIRANPKGYEFWVNGAVQTLTVIADALPPSLGEDDIGLTAEVSGILHDPRKMMNKLVLMFAQEGSPVWVSMKPWAQSIIANIKTVKGARLNRSTKDVFPDERRLSMSAYDLAHDVFRDTPLLDVLSVHVPVSVSKQARTEHMNFVGPSGTGKTQFLQNMLVGDLKDVRAGKSTVVIFDTDGTLSHKVMLHAASDPKLAKRVVYIDPSKEDLRPRINLVNLGPKGGGNELVSYVIAALGEKLTDRMGNFFRMVSLTIKAIPNANLDTLIRLLSEEDYGQRYLGDFNHDIASFVRDDLFGGTFAATREQVAGRLKAFRALGSLGDMFRHDTTDLDMGEILDQGSLVIIRLNKVSLDEGGLGEHAKLACRFYMASIVMAIRARNAYEDNMPTWLYLDEIADLIGGGDDRFLIEFFIQARKKNAGAVIAYQLLGQLVGSLREVAMVNTSIKISGPIETTAERNEMAGSMDCSPSLLKKARKTKTHGKVACKIRGDMDSAAICEFPFLTLESRPKGSKQDLENLMDAQRSFWAGKVTATERPRPVAVNESVVQFRKDESYGEWDV